MRRYDDKEFFIENDFKRYSIGRRPNGLKKNVDGSIVHRHFEVQSRGRQAVELVQAPARSFNLTMVPLMAGATILARFLSPAA